MMNELELLKILEDEGKNCPIENEEFDDTFGVCPKCGRHDGYLNLSQAHYFICREHRFKWWVGSNLFSSWRGQSAETFAQNDALLRGYEEIMPVTLK